jgi:GNAT superfamily N-acetyltransferase
VPAVRGNDVSQDRLTLGSIQPFPGRGGTGTLADVWRLSPIAGEAIRVRTTRREDYAAIRAVQRDTVPHVPPWSLRQLESQVHAFPEGQLVAEADGRICGAAATLVVDWTQHAAGHTWRTITGDGLFTTHQAHGNALYCAALVTDTPRRGHGIARMLLQAQRRLCRRLNLPRILAAARMPGYAEQASALSPEEYAMRVVWGDLDDAEIRFRLAQGFQFCGVLRSYLPEDGDSGGHAALFAWLNPLHAPPKPPASIASERRRKAA